jgi:TM2 domain-containing membrane protein YozV
MSAMQMENNQGGRPSWPIPGMDPMERKRKVPALAAILSLMPGLGQVYVGYYIRGFIHVIVVATTITLLANGAGHAMMDGEITRDALNAAPLLGLFLSFFWLYNMIDAWRLASLYNEALLAGRTGDAKIDLPLPSAGGALTGGIVLVVVGLILFLNTMFGMSLDWLRDWWPLAPVGFGIYLIAQAVRDRKRKG